MERHWRRRSLLKPIKSNIMLNPIPESEAPDEVKINYQKIKNALQLTSLPIFFSYLGSFPLYLNHVTTQITNNLSHPDFQRISEETSINLQSLIKSSLMKSDEPKKWLQLYKNSPSFYYFQNDLRNIFLTNIKLAFIFMSLREALKGWAIAAKKLGSSKTESVNEGNKKTDSVDETSRFIFEGFSPSTDSVDETSEKTGSVVQWQHTSSNQLVIRENSTLEKDMLPEFLHLCKLDFLSVLKKDEFWVLRVGVEELILRNLSLFPELIFSPINLTLRLTFSNPDYPDLLYLIAEHFPTYAMQRMLFSGYMMEE